MQTSSWPLTADAGEKLLYIKVKDEKYEHSQLPLAFAAETRPPQRYLHHLISAKSVAKLLAIRSFPIKDSVSPPSQILDPQPAPDTRVLRIRHLRMTSIFKQKVDKIRHVLLLLLPFPSFLPVLQQERSTRARLPPRKEELTSKGFNT